MYLMSIILKGYTNWKENKNMKRFFRVEFEDGNTKYVEVYIDHEGELSTSDMYKAVINSPEIEVSDLNRIYDIEEVNFDEYHKSYSIK